jgi:cysteinyl-tRNA synthetase
MCRIRKYILFIWIVIPAFILIAGCTKDDNPVSGPVDYRQEMRNFVINIGSYARSLNHDFIIIPQNGQELITDNGEAAGVPQTAYLQAIDATGREDMFYGFTGDDVPTPEADKKHMVDLCLLCEQHGVEVVATDYCSTHSNMDDSYQQNELRGFISFAANERNLDIIPDYPVLPYHVNADNITTISNAKNVLYLINSEKFETKQDFINAVSGTDYDMVIMDLYHNESVYSQTEINRLKTKHNGGRRMVVCYMSIGEAENYRYYWNPEWNSSKPAWLGSENPEWAGNYKVNYWDRNWQQFIFGNESSYLKKIIDAGFDGAYLDIVDAFEYFEGR